MDDTRYAPYAVTADPRRWDLHRRTVDTSLGPVVVHHRAGPDALLLLHGVAGSWTTWTPLLDATDGVPGRGLVLVDLPGWGSSPAPAAPLGVEDAARVLLAVLDTLGVAGVDVVGHSMGAFVAMHLAVVAPERVRSVALVSGTTFAGVEAVRHPLHGLRTVPAFTLLRAGLAVTRDTARPALRVLAGIGLLPLLAAPVFTHVRRLDRSVLDAFVAELRPRAFLGAARSGAGYDLSRWSAVRCPVTAVSGEGDVFATHADLARLAALVPQARTVLLPDCGHFAHVERPHAVADLVLRAGEAGRLHRAAADRRLAS